MHDNPIIGFATSRITFAQFRCKSPEAQAVLPRAKIRQVVVHIVSPFSWLGTKTSHTLQASQAHRKTSVADSATTYLPRVMRSRIVRRFKSVSSFPRVTTRSSSSRPAASSRSPQTAIHNFIRLLTCSGPLSKGEQPVVFRQHSR